MDQKKPEADMAEQAVGRCRSAWEILTKKLNLSTSYIGKITFSQFSLPVGKFFPF